MGVINRIAEKRAAFSAPVHVGDAALARLLGFGSITSAGVHISPDNYRQVPEADACVSLIEDTVATLPLDFYRRKGDTRERADDEPLHILVHDRPNEWQTSAEFRGMMEGFRIGYGNAYAKVVSSRGFPTALEPLHPDLTTPFRTSAGAIAYRYSPPNGSTQILLAGEVLHLRDKPYERDLICGQSRVIRHKDTLGRALATMEYISKFFSNGAVPKTFLVPAAGQSLAEPQRDAIRKAFEEKHAGLQNAHRVGVLPALLDIKTIGVNNEEAQLVESYKLAVRQMGSIFGVPLHLIGEMANTVGAGAGGTGIEQQSLSFLIYHARAKLVVWEQALNKTLMSRDMGSRYYFEFNADGLLRGDFKSRMDGYALMVQWGLATANEIRRQINMPPVAGGDERLLPLNMVPATQIMDVLLKTAGKDNNPAAQKDALDAATRALAVIVTEYNEQGRKLLRAA
jgi:HK97 family phage portal protein